MGNPPSHHPGEPVPTAPPSTNGLLIRIPGQLISDGAAQLPPAGPNELKERKSIVVVPDHGAVMVTYQLDWYKRGRSKFWHWVAVFAEKA